MELDLKDLRAVAPAEADRVERLLSAPLALGRVDLACSQGNAAAYVLTVAEAAAMTTGSFVLPEDLEAQWRNAVGLVLAHAGAIARVQAADKNNYRLSEMFKDLACDLQNECPLDGLFRATAVAAAANETAIRGLSDPMCLWEQEGVCDPAPDGWDTVVPVLARWMDYAGQYPNARAAEALRLDGRNVMGMVSSMAAALGTGAGWQWREVYSGRATAGPRGLDLGTGRCLPLVYAVTSGLPLNRGAGAELVVPELLAFTRRGIVPGARDPSRKVEHLVIGRLLRVSPGDEKHRTRVVRALARTAGLGERTRALASLAAAACLRPSSESLAELHEFAPGSSTMFPGKWTDAGRECLVRGLADWLWFLRAAADLAEAGRLLRQGMEIHDEAAPRVVLAGPQAPPETATALFDRWWGPLLDTELSAYLTGIAADGRDNVRVLADTLRESRRSKLEKGLRRLLEIWEAGPPAGDIAARAADGVREVCAAMADALVTEPSGHGGAARGVLLRPLMALAVSGGACWMARAAGGNELEWEAGRVWRHVTGAPATRLSCAGSALRVVPAAWRGRLRSQVAGCDAFFGHPVVLLRDPWNEGAHRAFTWFGLAVAAVDKLERVRAALSKPCETWGLLRAWGDYFEVVRTGCLGALDAVVADKGEDE